MNLDLSTKESQTYLVIGIVVTFFIILKFGVVTYILVTLFYYLFYLLKLEVSSREHKTTDVDKMWSWFSRPFLFENASWMDPNLKDELQATADFCKKKGMKITILEEQIDAIAAIKNSSATDSDEFTNSSLALDRMENFQKEGILRIIPKVKAPAPKPNVLQEACQELNDDCHTNLNLYVTPPPAPAKPASPKAQFLNGLIHLSKLVTSKYPDKSISYVTLDQELRIRIREIMQRDPSVKIDFISLQDYMDVCEYLNRFRIVWFGGEKKKRISMPDISKINPKKQLDPQIDTIKKAIAIISEYNR